MINARELRIGNLLLLNNQKVWSQYIDKVVRLEGIDLSITIKEKEIWKDSFGYLKLVCKEETFNQFSQYAKPIPLTEEWFLKFGFIIRFFNDDTNKPLMWKVEENRHIELYFEKQVQSYVFMINKLQYSTEIKHVHQLQNLYFALTNKELVLQE